VPSATHTLVDPEALTVREQEHVTRKFTKVGVEACGLGPLGSRAVPACASWRSVLVQSCIKISGDGRQAVPAPPPQATLHPPWQALINILGPSKCILAPDIGTDERNMGWVFDQVELPAWSSPSMPSTPP